MCDPAQTLKAQREQQNAGRTQAEEGFDRLSLPKFCVLPEAKHRPVQEDIRVEIRFRHTTPKNPEQIEALVKSLGARQFSEREGAMKALKGAISGLVKAVTLSTIGPDIKNSANTILRAKHISISAKLTAKTV